LRFSDRFTIFYWRTKIGLAKLYQQSHVTEPHSLRPSTLRVRRHRQRRREGLRLLTVEIPEPVIEAAIARGLLKPEDCTQSSSVMRSAFAAQLSDTALNWLTSNAVITREQRADAVAILQRISEWLEGAPAEHVIKRQ
jgi:hypothetical protein